VADVRSVAEPAEEMALPAASGPAEAKPYLLDEQVGFLLRQASQRHTAIFAARMIEDLTPTQWAALVRLAERGPSSQNLLGRVTAMDAATIKGVIDRLVGRGLAETHADAKDSRRLTVALTEPGREFVARAAAAAHAITQATLAPLNASERRTIVRLLGKLK
jgi:MarR family transcriptional regulator, lower aerobic nicotinate degradation pathway regulator